MTRSRSWSSAGPDPVALTSSSQSLGLAFANTTGRTQVYPGTASGQRRFAPLMVGQSLMASFADVLATNSYSSQIDMLNINNGGVYTAQDPLLSAGYDPNREALGLANGNVGIPIANKVIAANYTDRVTLVNVAIGGTSVANWATGPLADRLRIAWNRMKAINLVPSCVMWEQGQADAAGATSGSDYQDRLTAIITNFRALDPALAAVPWLIAQSTFPATDPGKTTIRAAQAAVVNVPNHILAGPDTDTLNGTYRHDGVHWNSSGLNAASDLWVAKLAALF